MELNELLKSLINEELADISLYAGEAKLFADKLVGGEHLRAARDFLQKIRDANECESAPRTPAAIII